MGVKNDFIMDARSQLFRQGICANAFYRHALEHLESVCPGKEKKVYFLRERLLLTFWKASVVGGDWRSPLAPDLGSFTKKMAVLPSSTLFMAVSMIPNMRQQ